MLHFIGCYNSNFCFYKYYLFFNLTITSDSSVYQNFEDVENKDETEKQILIPKV